MSATSGIVALIDNQIIHAFQNTYKMKNKNNAFKLSTQVKNILQEKGLSKSFNYSDYKYFKTKCKNAWNKAQAIAELFTQENTNSDFNDYVF